jgi:hypothetical protein
MLGSSPESAAPAGGGMSREGIRAVVRAHRAELRACYENQLVGDPALAGTLVLGIVVQPDGAVRSVGLFEDALESTTEADEAVEACVLERVRGWRFPETRGGLVGIRYPFVFTAGE